MTIDYELCGHRNGLETGPYVGYVVTFHTERVLLGLYEKFNISAEIHKKYKIPSNDFYRNLIVFLRDSNFSGIIGDDSWILFAESNKDYWESIYGKGYLALYERNVWDSIEQLPTEQT